MSPLLKNNNDSNIYARIYSFFLIKYITNFLFFRKQHHIHCTLCCHDDSGSDICTPFIGYLQVRSFEAMSVLIKCPLFCLATIFLAFCMNNDLTQLLKYVCNHIHHLTRYCYPAIQKWLLKMYISYTVEKLRLSF